MEGVTEEGKNATTNRRSSSESTDPDSQGLYDEPFATVGNLDLNANENEVRVKVEDKVDIDIETSRQGKTNRKAKYCTVLLILMVGGFAVLGWKYFELRKENDKLQKENDNEKHEKETLKQYESNSPFWFEITEMLSKTSISPPKKKKNQSLDSRVSFLVPQSAPGSSHGRLRCHDRCLSYDRFGQQK